MARSAHDKHFADLWSQQSAQRERWSGNLSPEVPVVQPFQRSMSGGVEADTYAHRVATGTPREQGRSRHTETYPPVASAGIAPGPLTLILPFPPTLNNSSMPDGHGGRYLTDQHRAFRKAVAWEVAKRKLARIDGRLSVRIDLYPSDNRRWDVDNRAKAVLDALQHAGLFKDDSAVDDLHITRQIAGNEAWCAVTVRTL